MDRISDVFKIALTQYGVREWSGSNHNPEVVKYFTECGFDVKNRRDLMVQRLRMLVRSKSGASAHQKPGGTVMARMGR